MTAIATEGAEARGVTRRAVHVLSWLGALGALAVAALWLARIPPSLSSDDALFLLHALTRFSILDFSPQFPGYPGTVGDGLKRALDALGNPGVFGVGARKPDPATFAAARADIFKALGLTP